MDFVSDALEGGKRFRPLTLIDTWTRECLAVHVNISIKRERVVEVVQEVSRHRGVPARIQVDNGSEFISKALDLWAYQQGVPLDFSRPGRPTDNPFIESFNGSFRDECLRDPLLPVAVRLPPYAPELQPAERLWKLTDATVANRCFDSLNEFQTVLGEQCAWLETQPDLLTQRTLFHWWPLSSN